MVGQVTTGHVTTGQQLSHDGQASQISVLKNILIMITMIMLVTSVRLQTGGALLHCRLLPQVKTGLPTKPKPESQLKMTIESVTVMTPCAGLLS